MRNYVILVYFSKILFFDKYFDIKVSFFNCKERLVSVRGMLKVC